MARRVEIIPTSWDRSNPLWDKPAPRRVTFNVGLVGLHVLPKDLMGIKTELARFLREVPQALVVVAQDLRLYEALDTVPEDRRLFLPPGRLDDYPYLLGNFDILLAPRQNSPYHQAGSDQPLLEAGARRIPWVAAPIPAFQEWAVGGLFAEKNGGWYSALQRLAGDAALRAELGEAGRKKAEGRSAEICAGRWLKLFSELWI
jgi:glycosyltransferase involved in cell wall biosynthesis